MRTLLAALALTMVGTSAMAHEGSRPHRHTNGASQAQVGPRTQAARTAPRTTCTSSCRGRVVVRPPVRTAVPPRVIVRTTPPRTVVVRPPPRTVVVRPAPRTVVVRPPPRTVVVQSPPRTVVVPQAVPAPRPAVVYQTRERKERTPFVDREGSFAIGLKSASYISGYDAGAVYGDFGLGLMGRYRPTKALGVEAVLVHHDQTFNQFSERKQTLMQGSAMLFGNSQGRFQPYVIAGLSANARGINDFVQGSNGTTSVDATDVLWGPHAGAGLEVAFGERTALDLEAKYIGWINEFETGVPGALQTSANVVVHF